MPVERPFGKWNVLSVFNFTGKTPREGFTYTTPTTRALIGKFTVPLDAAKDLRLDPNKEYIVYEFWSKKLIGTFKGTFTPRPVKPVRLRYLQHRRKTRPAGADLDQPAYPADGV